MSPDSLVVVLLGICVILSFDAGIAYLMKKMDLNIILPSLISALFYIILGNILGTIGGTFSAAILCALVGLVDATVGLRIVFHINPQIENWIKNEINTENTGLVIFMILLASGLGTLGAII